MGKSGLPRSGNQRELLRSAYDTHSLVQEIRLSVRMEGKTPGRIKFGGSDTEKMDPREKAVQPIKGRRKQQRDDGFAQPFYDADIEETVFCVGGRTEFQTAAFKAAVHRGCKIGTPEYHTASVVKDKL